LCFTVEQVIGRDDGYFSCTSGLVRTDGYMSHTVSVSSLSSSELVYDGYEIPVSIDGTDSAFDAVPFTPIEWKVVPLPFWQPYFLNLSSEARLLPATFTFAEGIEDTSCTATSTFVCENPNEVAPVSDPGRNDFYVPDNLIIGRGQLLRPDGTPFKNDIEIGTVILELPKYL
jgi:hypothetical protein